MDFGFAPRHQIKLQLYLPGLDQSPSAVHVVLGVHDKHHLVSVEFKSTVQTAGVFHSQLAVPLSPASHRLNLPHLPAAETTQVPVRRDTDLRGWFGFQDLFLPNLIYCHHVYISHLGRKTGLKK